MPTEEEVEGFAAFIYDAWGRGYPPMNESRLKHGGHSPVWTDNLLDVERNAYRAHARELLESKWVSQKI